MVLDRQSMEGTAHLFDARLGRQAEDLVRGDDGGPGGPGRRTARAPCGSFAGLRAALSRGFRAPLRTGPARPAVSGGGLRACRAAWLRGSLRRTARPRPEAVEEAEPPVLVAPVAVAVEESPPPFF